MTTPTDWREMCTELLNVIDSLPCETNYKGESRYIFLIDEDVIFRVRAALAQPEPERPTDEDLLGVAASVIEPYESYGIAIGEYEAETECAVEAYGSELISFARAVLARFTRPAIEPVPIAERLPEPEDCDAEGKCWWSRHLNKDPSWDFNAREWFYTQWLPYHALPLPTNEQ